MTATLDPTLPQLAPLPPMARELVTGGVGLLALGACAGLGSGDAFVTLRAIPAALLVTGGALALTTPSLLVGHQFLRLRARPDALGAAIAVAFGHTGRVALGLAPTMLFFSATSGLWLPIWLLLLGAVSGFGLLDAVSRLTRAEPDEGPLPALRHGSLVLAWMGLSALIAARLAFDVFGFVLGGA